MSIANASGFPLQIRIANVASSIAKWKVILEEHPWHSDETNSKGFLDLVIIERDHQFESMVIECKRVRDTSWVFLVPKTDSNKCPDACLWDSKYIDSRWEGFGWKPWQAMPLSYESQFCAIPGQEHGRRNLLERTASDLIEAIEAFALQEKELQEKLSSENTRIGFTGFHFNRVYIPVIVTTAELVISHFEPGDISLKDGNLPSNASFEVVSSIRFRKSLTHKLPSSPQDSIENAHYMTERTVFIVNAEGFREFLEDWIIR
jgi:hypothetical protein